MGYIEGPYVSNDLTGHVALVTGASSGLGRRFAQTLAAAGAKVAATARRVDKLEELAKEIEAHGGECVPIALDVTDAESIAQAVAHANEALGLVDILVNNAGIPDAQRAHKMSLELTDAVLDTNVRGPWLLANEVARRLIAAEAAGPHRQHRLDRRVQLRRQRRRAVLDLQGGHPPHDRGAGRRVVAVQHQRQLHRPRRLRLRDDGRDAERGWATSPSTSRASACGDPAQLDSTLLYLVSPASEAVTGTTIKVDDGQGTR